MEVESDKLIFPSCSAIPTRTAVSDFPADAQYHILSLVNESKYFSIAIFPSFSTKNALVLVDERKEYRESIFVISQPRAAGETVSHSLPVRGGK